MTASAPTSQPSWGTGLNIALAVTMLGLIQLEIWVFGSNDIPLGTQLAASIIAPMAALPIAFRSQYPTKGFVVNIVAVIALIMVGYPSDVYQWTNLIMLFTLAEKSSRGEAALGLGASLAGIALFVGQFITEIPLLSFGFISASWIAAWLGGRILQARLRQEALQADRDMAAELAEARQVALESETQRTQMARELHDLIGHTVNVMVVHAGAGRRAVPNDTDGALRAFQTIESTGRSALDELDRVLGILRRDRDGTPTTALPGLDDLPTLQEQFSDAGLETTIDVTGDTSTVPASTGLAVYRIIQEALTNTLKHAEARQATAEVCVNSETVAVEVTDDGRGSDGTEPGRGLRGITERAEIHGGTARFDNSDSGGFRVRCQLRTTGTG